MIHKMYSYGLARCGARARDGAERTTIDRNVTCPECRARVAAMRAKAKAVFAGLSSGIALREAAGDHTPLTIAGRTEMVLELLGGRPILDDNGSPTGEVAAQLISRATAREMLAEFPAAVSTAKPKRSTGRNAGNRRT